MSTTRNSQVDAYVLSESSMFISRRRFILKTCGTTTPLDCIEHLTRLVTEHAKFDTVEVKQFIFVHLFFWGGALVVFGDQYSSIHFRLFQEIFYSRKNFQRPDLQKPPHKNFREEVKILEKYFGAGAGSDDEIFMCNIFYPISLLSLLHGQPE